MLITGASGFLGWHLVNKLREAFELTGAYGLHPQALQDCDAMALNLAAPDSVEAALAGCAYDVIVHAAAMTHPDQCEKDPDGATRVNVQGTDVLAQWAAGQNAFFIYISTDLVFDGRQDAHRGGYTEADPVSPVSHYGRTKVLAEEAVRRRCRRWVILRPSLLYARGTGWSHSFVDWLHENLSAGKSVGLFHDQFRTFLYAPDVAAAIDRILWAGVSNEVLHLAGPERLSRRAFGERFTDVFGYPRDLIRSISISELKDYAPRGNDCSLRAARIAELGFVPTSVQQGLAAMKAAGEGGV